MGERGKDLIYSIMVRDVHNRRESTSLAVNTEEIQAFQSV